MEFLKLEYGADWVEKMGTNEELRRDLDAGRDALTRAMKASWWNWDSSLFSGDGLKNFERMLEMELPYAFVGNSQAIINLNTGKTTKKDEKISFPKLT